MLAQVVCSRNRLFFAFLWVSYVLGVLLYDFLGFDYTDELLTLLLAALTFTLLALRGNRREWIPFIGLGAVFLFYLVYSFALHSNVPRAIVKDFVIQLKPFLGFFCAYALAPRLSAEQKRWTCLLCLMAAAALLIIGLTDPYCRFFGHMSRYATAVVATFFLLLYCSDFRWADVGILLCILAMGLLSTRAKFYGFFGLTVCLMAYYWAFGRLRLNGKSVALLLILFAVALWLAREKIVIYYVDGMMNSREMWSRPAMMLTGGRLLADYFPFGCGLGSFGTFASGEYYSPIYAAYGLDQLWGLSKQNPAFICDAFYPELAQFGVVGVALYVAFWVFILRKARRLPVKEQLLVWLGFFFFLIEGVADSTFTHNRGVFILILLGITLSRCHEAEK